MILSHGYVAQRAARAKHLSEERAAKDRVTRARSEGRSEGHSDGVREERERNTFELSTADGHRVIGEYPKAEFVRVYLGPRHATSEDFRDLRYHYSANAQVVTFRALRKAWTSGDGHTVVWFDWERVR